MTQVASLSRSSVAEALALWTLVGFSAAAVLGFLIFGVHPHLLTRSRGRRRMGVGCRGSL